MMYLHTQEGLSLTELMVTLAVSSVVLASIYGTFSQQQRVYTTQGQIVEMQQNARLGIDIMTNELRMAGFDIPVGTKAGIVLAEGDALRFTMHKCAHGFEPDADCPSCLSTADVCYQDVRYFLQDSGRDGDLDLMRTSGTKGRVLKAQPVVDNIADLRFCYHLADSPDPTTCMTAPEEERLPHISAVQITLIAKTAHADPHYKHPHHHDGYRTMMLTARAAIPGAPSHIENKRF